MLNATAPKTTAPTRRLTSGRLDYLDSIRGIAALVVVLHHCWLGTAPASFASHGLASYCLHRVIGVHPGAAATDFLKRESNPDLSFVVLAQHLVMFGTKEAMRLDSVMWTLVH